MRSLEAAHGPVEHIVLGTLGLEHKALAGPFARAFPRAICWVQPGQWSFPLPLPLPAFGFPLGRRLRELPADGSGGRGVSSNAQRTRYGYARVPPPWANEIAFEVLGPLKFRAVGAFGETAFYHASTSTLLLTDMVIRVEAEPPPILTEASPPHNPEPKTTQDAPWP